MQLHGATELEQRLYDTCHAAETGLGCSELATRIVVAMSDASNELQKLRNHREHLIHSCRIALDNLQWTIRNKQNSLVSGHDAQSLKVLKGALDNAVGLPGVLGHEVSKKYREALLKMFVWQAECVNELLPENLREEIGLLLGEDVIEKVLFPKAKRCPKCGYTKEDAAYYGDHRLCDGVIPT